MSDDRGFRITEIHVICGIDPDGDFEGIPAKFTSMGPIPLIAADAKRLSQIKQMAQEIADITQRNFKIVRFSVREDIGEIKSRTTS